MGCLQWVFVMGLGGATLLIPAIAHVTLPLMGFTIVGPMIGSCASGAQSSMGDVAGGSIFSGLQSMATRS